MTMRVVSIRFPEQICTYIEYRAEQGNVSFAQWVREATIMRIVFQRMEEIRLSGEGDDFRSMADTIIAEARAIMQEPPPPTPPAPPQG